MPPREKKSRRHAPPASLPATMLAALILPGCNDPRSGVQTDNPELSAYVRLMMPQRIEIQRYLTKPVSSLAGGDADSLEVILAAYDSVGDYTKIAGELHFELHTFRMASGDRVGKRVGFWSVELNSRDSFIKYRDSPTPFYKFPLRFEGNSLPPGRYILNARLISPTGDKIFDEYEFTHAAAGAGSP